METGRKEGGIADNELKKKHIGKTGKQRTKKKRIQSDVEWKAKQGKEKQSKGGKLRANKLNVNEGWAPNCKCASVSLNFLRISNESKHQIQKRNKLLPVF